MQITFKLYATLSEYLPEETEKNSTIIEIPENASTFEVIDQFNIPRDKAHLVLLNGIYIHPEDRNNPIIKEGDTLAIWPPVAGG